MMIWEVAIHFFKNFQTDFFQEYVRFVAMWLFIAEYFRIILENPKHVLAA